MTSYQESAEPDWPQSLQVRAIVRIEGNVQGVGFRPFLFRLATQYGLSGVVFNSAQGLQVEIEGPRSSVQSFLEDVPRCRPPLAMIAAFEYQFAQPLGRVGFVIADSKDEGQRTAWVSPDVAICADCLAELFDGQDRRYRYPFINCTNCGPRYTIIAGVPYDRPLTSMACFAMCSTCQAEYAAPANRRFHAQPNACPSCGPQVWLAVSDALEVPERSVRHVPEADPIEEAVRLLQQGAIVAVKGIGGFHLACDASNDVAVKILRQRKQRPEKPFALMVPDLNAAAEYCQLDEQAEQILSSLARPITLLPRRGNAPATDAVAPGQGSLGLMLPYTPLHHLLLFDATRAPRFRGLVMTSGNRAEEPLAMSNHEALQRLGTIADAFLLHDREILMSADDSVVRYDPRASGRRAEDATSNATMIRRSRGYVPAPLVLDRDVGECLAVGGHLKNTLAVSRGNRVFLSQHIGDLSDLETLSRWTQTAQQLQQMLAVRPAIVAHDLHPDYLSTQQAHEFEDVQLVAVQHHHAHVAACMAEHHVEGPVIGVALDGTGYGVDGHVWGGEILIADYDQFQRAAHLRYVPLPGGEKAIQQPWRIALSYLDAVYGERLWELPIPFVRQRDRAASELLLHATRSGVNAPLTSSCGRLFDAVAALLGLRQEISYEGQAAMELEFAIGSEMPKESDLPAGYELFTANFAAAVTDASPSIPCAVLDPSALIKAVVADIEAEAPLSLVSWRFHQALAQSFANVVERIARRVGLRQVVLSGGCLQNRVLHDALSVSLERMGLSVFVPRRFPANDGGLALGQLVVAAARNASSRESSVAKPSR